eukprot:TRINITY_DN1232_c0_g4_i2.p3 TRINITY_DN1232_c0_g4~~TRINITY_DN1232_c0_g4_i2.p3  ORF type:complete len:338 (-),score=45.45 TRINITY_DN1232_c0_g4_i2:1107-2120(-)
MSSVNSPEITLKALVLLLFNVFAVSGVVFANKMVFKVFDWNFAYALTWLHALTTLIGMHIFKNLKFFEPKTLPRQRLIVLAALYVGYIVFGNLNLNYNTVGFYQISKLVIAPTVLGLEALFMGKRPTYMIILSVLITILGVGFATVTDAEVTANTIGLLVGVGAIVASAGYTVWVSKLQKELEVNGSQLLYEYASMAVMMLGVVTLTFEPIGIGEPEEGTLLGYKYTITAVFAILLSAVLGLLVSLSTFLLIGATSALTYNVVGHLKTVVILTGGVIFFGDSMPLKKAFGVGVAMLGIIWYSRLKMEMGKQIAKSSKVPNGNALAQFLPQDDKKANA